MILWSRDVTIFGEKQTITITPLVLLVLFAIVLRIPTLFEPYWYGDEAIYLTLGEGIRQGLLLYRDLFDHKPPLIYLLASLSGSLFWFKFALLLSSVLSIVLFWKLAGWIFENKFRPIFFSSIVFTLLTTLPTLEGNIANSELFMLALTLGAFVLLSDPKRISVKRTFLAGLLFSISFLYKVPGVFDLLAIIAFWMFSIKSVKSFQRIVFYTLILFSGVFTPVLVSVVYFGSQGALAQYLDAAGFININYISRWGSGDSGGGLVLGSGFFLRTVVFAGALGVLYLFKRFFTLASLFVSIWFLFTLFSALLSGRPYPHYLIQVVPPFALLVAFLGFGKVRERLLPIPFFLLLSVTVFYYKFSYYPTYPYYANFLSFATGQKTKDEYFKAFNSRVPRIYALSSLLSQRTDPGDPVFIWGTAPEIYALSRRVPPIPYVTSFHIGDFEKGEEVMLKISSNKPKYILIMPEEQRSLPGFQTFLMQNYIYIENVDGVEVWKLLNPDIAQYLRRQ